MFRQSLQRASVSPRILRSACSHSRERVQLFFFLLAAIPADLCPPRWLVSLLIIGFFSGRNQNVRNKKTAWPDFNQIGMASEVEWVIANALKSYALFFWRIHNIDLITSSWISLQTIEQPSICKLPVNLGIFIQFMSVTASCGLRCVFSWNLNSLQLVLSVVTFRDYEEDTVLQIASTGSAAKVQRWLH